MADDSHFPFECIEGQILYCYKEKISMLIKSQAFLMFLQTKSEQKNSLQSTKSFHNHNSGNVAAVCRIFIIYYLKKTKSYFLCIIDKCK